jgi:hypothetical protein
MKNFIVVLSILMQVQSAFACGVDLFSAPLDPVEVGSPLATPATPNQSFAASLMSMPTSAPSVLYSSFSKQEVSPAINSEISLTKQQAKNLYKLCMQKAIFGNVADYYLYVPKNPYMKTQGQYVLACMSTNEDGKSFMGYYHLVNPAPNDQFVINVSYQRRTDALIDLLAKNTVSTLRYERADGVKVEDVMAFDQSKRPVSLSIIRTETNTQGVVTQKILRRVAPLVHPNGAEAGGACEFEYDLKVRNFRQNPSGELEVALKFDGVSGQIDWGNIAVAKFILAADAKSAKFSCFSASQTGCPIK